MKFLQEEFEQSLIADIAEDGAVVIGETSFTPTLILQNDPSA